MAIQVKERRRRRQRGNEIVEFSFLLIPTLALFSMMVDIAWLVYTKSTLSFAVENGARYAMANRTDAAGNVRSDATEQGLILQEVKSWSNGLLTNVPTCTWNTNDGTLSPPGQKCIGVVWYDQKDPSKMVALGGGANVSGNIVVVSVENYSERPLVPMFYSFAPLVFGNVTASDRMD